jgi:hypothetical protein
MKLDKFILDIEAGARGSVVSWLRHYATRTIPSSRTVALGSTKPVTEMSTRNLPGGKELPARKADSTAICEPTA